MIMNERIQELISAYLLRDTSPEQERELFEACSRHPETSELLRQHLILSLKLRSLREEVQVPTELQNDVLRSINTLEAEGLREEVQNVPVTKAEPGHRFGWAHLLGTGFATAACAVAIVLWNGSTDERGTTTLQQVAQTQDTVFIVKKDTVTQLREIDRPVYIVRTVPEIPAPDRAVTNDAGELAQQQDRTSRSAETGTALNSDAPRDADLPSVPVGDSEAREKTTLFADNHAHETIAREAKKENYLEQYNTMLVSVESVQLSSKDRIH
jgi:hypothetical protein